MNEWQTLTLADVCTVITDGAHQSPKTVSRGKPMASVKDLTRFGVDLTSARHIATEDFEALVKQGCKPHVGDVLIAKDGNSALDTVCTVDHPLDAVLLSSVAILRPDPKCLDSVFLKFYLSSPETIDYLKSNFISGAAIPRVVLRDFKRAEIRLPSLDVQRRIAGVLQSIDSKIDLNRRVNQTLEAMAQAIFQSWFVEFDPVKAKIAAKQEGRDPLRAAMTAVSGKADAELDALPPEQYEQLAATAVLFPDEMEESELGEIPKGCIAGSLGDICNFTAGSAFSPEHQGSAGGDYPFIKVSDMNLVGNEVFIQSANNYVSQARQLEMKAKLHPQGATVFAKIGVALISNRRRLLITPTIIDNNMMSASPIEGKSASYFLYSMLSTIDFNTLVSGTALPYLNVSDLRKIPIVRPLDGVCRAFELKAASIFLMMQKLAAQSVTLASVRDALLPKLLSGEIEVSGLDEG